VTEPAKVLAAHAFYECHVGVDGSLIGCSGNDAFGEIAHLYLYPIAVWVYYEVGDS
jgi:hypothetical protein